MMRAWTLPICLLLCGCTPSVPQLPPLPSNAPPAVVSLSTLPAPAPGPALSIEELQQMLQCALIMQAEAPAGSTVALITHDALETGGSGPALVCATRTVGADVSVLQMLPATRADGMRELEAYRDWLERHGLTAIIVEQHDVITLLLERGGDANVMLQVSDAGARVVRGARDAAAARALLAQLFPE